MLLLQKKAEAMAPYQRKKNFDNIIKYYTAAAIGAYRRAVALANDDTETTMVVNGKTINKPNSIEAILLLNIINSRQINLKMKHELIKNVFFYEYKIGVGFATETKIKSINEEIDRLNKIIEDFSSAYDGRTAEENTKRNADRINTLKETIKDYEARKEAYEEYNAKINNSDIRKNPEALYNYLLGTP